MAHVTLMVNEYGKGTTIAVDGVELQGCRRISFDLEAGDDLPIVEIELVAHELTLMADGVKLLAAAGADFIMNPDERRALLDVHRFKRGPSLVDALHELHQPPTVERVMATLAGGGHHDDKVRQLVDAYLQLPDDVRLDIVESLDLGDAHLYATARAALDDDRQSSALEQLDRGAFARAQVTDRLTMFRAAIDSATRNEADAAGAADVERRRAEHEGEHNLDKALLGMARNEIADQHKLNEQLVTEMGAIGMLNKAAAYLQGVIRLDESERQQLAGGLFALAGNPLPENPGVTWPVEPLDLPPIIADDLTMINDGLTSHVVELGAILTDRVAYCVAKRNCSGPSLLDHNRRANSRVSGDRWACQHCGGFVMVQTKGDVPARPHKVEP